MKNAVILRADGSKEVIDMSLWRDYLSNMQSIVGGFIEHVNTSIGADMWINEEGRLEGLPVNENATELYDPWANKEPIVGDVLLTNVDEGGETIGLTDHQVAFLMK